MSYLNVVKREFKRYYKRPLIWNISYILKMKQKELYNVIETHKIDMVNGYNK